MIKYIKILITFFNNLFSKKIPSEKFFFNLEIDIDKIKYFLELKHTLDKNNFIWDGNWDKKKIKISEYRSFSVNFNSIFQIYQENKNYEECDEYKKKTTLIQNGKITGRANNIYDLKNYFKSLDILRDNLKKFGYKSQQELKNNNKINDEIGVVIDRDGEIIKIEDNFGGTHRFALCKVLKIKKIIINVKAVHKSLLEERDLKNITTRNESSYIETILKNKIKY